LWDKGREELSGVIGKSGGDVESTEEEEDILDHGWG